MTTDHRAHERIDGLEAALRQHVEEHRAFEGEVRESVRLTKQVVGNTSELVELFRGAKGLRKLITFAWPPMLVVAALLYAAYVYVKGRL